MQTETHKIIERKKYIIIRQEEQSDRFSSGQGDNKYVTKQTKEPARKREKTKRETEIANSRQQTADKDNEVATLLLFKRNNLNRNILFSLIFFPCD